MVPWWYEGDGMVEGGCVVIKLHNLISIFSAILSTHLWTELSLRGIAFFSLSHPAVVDMEMQ